MTYADIVYQALVFCGMDEKEAAQRLQACILNAPEKACKVIKSAAEVHLAFKVTVEEYVRFLSLSEAQQEARLAKVRAELGRRAHFN